MKNLSYALFIRWILCWKSEHCDYLHFAIPTLLMTSQYMADERSAFASSYIGEIFLNRRWNIMKDIGNRILYLENVIFEFYTWFRWSLVGKNRVSIPYKAGTSKQTNITALRNWISNNNGLFSSQISSHHQLQGAGLAWVYSGLLSIWMCSPPVYFHGSSCWLCCLWTRLTDFSFFYTQLKMKVRSAVFNCVWWWWNASVSFMTMNFLTFLLVLCCIVITAFADVCRFVLFLLLLPH